MIRFRNVTKGQLYGALKGAFPDAKVSDDDLTALGLCLHRARAAGESLPQQLSHIDIETYSDELEALAGKLQLPGPAAPSTAGESTPPATEKVAIPRAADDANDYYWVESTHSRETPAGFEPFTGELAMARVRLPQTSPQAFHTAIGAILPGDHLVDTVLEANQKYARYLPTPIERLEIITPARSGVRFGAISILLGYQAEQAAAPFCYILEAGTATGQPKVLYLGRNMDVTINAYSGYQPTPFACPSHAYTGKLTMSGNDPALLQITSRKIEGGASQAPYIKIDASFTKQGTHIYNIWPGFLIARAATIVLGRAITGKISTDCEPHLPGARS